VSARGSVDDASARADRALTAAWTRRLAALVALPTVAASPDAAAFDAAAAHLAGWLRALGCADARVVARGGRPAIVATRRRGRARTLLVYGHYDVQPAGDERAWRHPPFRPVLAGGRLYGRGASDDKGPLLAHLAALDATLRERREPPVDLAFLIEGEEEIGSPGLGAIVAAERAALRCDAVVASDTEGTRTGTPAITIAQRGLLSGEIVVRTARRALHAGRYGGAVLGAADALAAIVAGLRDERGALEFPGRSEDVVAGPQRPALTVTALAAGEGRASIPSFARARIDVRLVPQQRPARVADLLARRVADLAPPGASAGVRYDAAVPPLSCDPDDPAIRAARRAVRAVWGCDAPLVHSGGTTGALGVLHRALGVPVVMLGFAHPRDAAHAPGESFAISSLPRIVATLQRFHAELAS
jgi:acetylornithine deacetylase/succinyl-diaminopimelate desuccinylase-like protein